MHIGVSNMQTNYSDLINIAVMLNCSTEFNMLDGVMRWHFHLLCQNVINANAKIKLIFFPIDYGGVLKWIRLEYLVQFTRHSIKNHGYFFTRKYFISRRLASLFRSWSIPKQKIINIYVILVVSIGKVILKTHEFGQVTYHTDPNRQDLEIFVTIDEFWIHHSDVEIKMQSKEE